MHILIIGAAGMVGRKLTQRLVADKALDGKTVEKLTLVDVVQPEAPAGFSGTVDARESDLSAPGEAETLVALPDPGRFPPDPADELRHAEGNLRTPPFRLQPPRLLRRHRHSPADHLHPPRQAEQGRLGLLFQYPARAAGRSGSSVAGLR